MSRCSKVDNSSYNENEILYRDFLKDSFKVGLDYKSDIMVEIMQN